MVYVHGLATINHELLMLRMKVHDALVKEDTKVISKLHFIMLTLKPFSFQIISRNNNSNVGID